jgi:hypothetical protein
VTKCRALGGTEGSTSTIFKRAPQRACKADGLFEGRVIGCNGVDVDENAGEGERRLIDQGQKNSAYRAINLPDDVWFT